LLAQVVDGQSFRAAQAGLWDATGLVVGGRGRERMGARSQRRNCARPARPSSRPEARLEVADLEADEVNSAFAQSMKPRGTSGSSLRRDVLGDDLRTIQGTWAFGSP